MLQLIFITKYPTHRSKTPCHFINLFTRINKFQFCEILYGEVLHIQTHTLNDASTQRTATVRQLSSSRFDLTTFHRGGMQLCLMDSAWKMLLFQT